ncbi:uncharacterized protein ATNIH1004_001180 [Aspergillus tanneri]|uniref:Uncharacterized protein n=1 Tax=Aspergillus tanneri TaxID=1220188 RepID=A0A5M9N1V4_9EURO|nr:uncharacterized protein ATNIH1004_001180 [Aspergillus tanneri]KAA8652276.1 hypothetical protein ATNIH1004_001180 [Aspergillus tanneri]
MFSDIPTPTYNQTAFRSQGEPPDEFNAQHDTGLTSIQQSYEQSFNNAEYPNNDETNSPSMNQMLTPSTESPRSVKAKRRESSMFLMELNQQAAHNRA